MTNSAAHKPSDLEPSYQGPTRNAQGYDYWTTTQEDEEALNIREQVAAGDQQPVAKKKKPRKKLFARGAGRRTFYRFFGLASLLAIVAAAYVAFNYVQVSGDMELARSGPADAIVVVGSAESSDRPSAELQERLDHAFNLYGDNVAPLIITVGEDAQATSSLASTYLEGRGVPARSLEVISQGSNTWAQLSAAAERLDELNLESAILVSESHKSHRLLAIAEDIGLDAEVAPTLVDPSFFDIAREAITVGIGRLAGHSDLGDFAG